MFISTKMGEVFLGKAVMSRLMRLLISSVGVPQGAFLSGSKFKRTDASSLNRDKQLVLILAKEEKGRERGEEARGGEGKEVQ